MKEIKETTTTLPAEEKNTTEKLKTTSLYDKYERPLEDKFEAMYEEICQEEKIKASNWLKQYQDKPMTARIQQVVNELNRG